MPITKFIWMLQVNISTSGEYAGAHQHSGKHITDTVRVDLGTTPCLTRTESCYCHCSTDLWSNRCKHTSRREAAHKTQTQRGLPKRKLCYQVKAPKHWGENGFIFQQIASFLMCTLPRIYFKFNLMFLPHILLLQLKSSTALLNRNK